jgi:ABC-type nitrate/sulfonate/bicarbonate transport system ATPase subunit
MPLSAPQPATVFWCDLRLPLHDNDTPETCWHQWRQHLPAWSDEIQATLIHDLRLTPHLGKRLNMLSTGSRRKVGLVAALASGATVTLIDQAFVSLDQSAIRVVQDVLRQASHHPKHACLIADYEVPKDVPLSSVLTLT